MRGSYLRSFADSLERTAKMLVSACRDTAQVLDGTFIGTDLCEELTQLITGVICDRGLEGTLPDLMVELERKIVIRLFQAGFVDTSAELAEKVLGCSDDAARQYLKRRNIRLKAIKTL